jgi:Tol biopolymer transport system component
MTATTGLLVAWAAWAAGPLACEGVGSQVARQQLPGPPGAPASVDVSADGRHVAFVSQAQLLPADDNLVDDVYVLERATGRLTLESAGADGHAANGTSAHPRLSADGRVVVFSSIAPALAGTRDHTGAQVFRRDRATGTTALVSRGVGGGPANHWTGHPDVSDDGRYVVFESRATDLVPGADANGTGVDIYLHDAADGSVRRVSVGTGGVQPAEGDSMAPAISGDGRAVAFTSSAPLDGRRPSAGPARRHVFLRELETGTVVRVSATRGGGIANGASYQPAISADGRRVAFVSTATDLNDDARAAAREHVYLYDRQATRLRLLTRSAAGGTADGGSRLPALSGNGRYVVFSSDASNLHCVRRCGAAADLNLVADVYRADTATDRIERVSGGGGSPHPWWNASTGPAADRSGRVVVFSSREPIHAADLAHDDDLYVEEVPAPDGPPCSPPAAGRRERAQPAAPVSVRGPVAAIASSMRMLVSGTE